MPAATAAYLAAHDPKGARVVAVGGPALAAARSAGLAAGQPADLASRALVGGDRYDTAAKVATRYRQAVAGGGSGSVVSAVGVATGANWPDAITASAAMGALRGPLLLTRPDGVPTATASSLAGMRGSLTHSVVFGGPAAVTPGAYADLATLLPRSA